MALQPAREARAHLKATVGLDACGGLPPLVARPAAVAAVAGASAAKAPLQVIVRIEDLALVVPVTSRCGISLIAETPTCAARALRPAQPL